MLNVSMSGAVHDRAWNSFMDDEGNPQRVRIYQALDSAERRKRGKGYSMTVTLSRDDAAVLADFLDVGWALGSIDSAVRYEYQQCVKVREKILALLAS